MDHEATPLLSLHGLGKRFGDQQALEAVDLTVHPGEVHALVGENGAGKSTLIRLLTGVFSPSAGLLRWAGEPVTFSGPAAAQRLGIRALHQERQLVPGFSALENLYLGEPYPQRGGRVDWPSMRRQARGAQEAFGLDLPLDEPAQQLSPTQRTLTELLRAVMVRSRLLILDEPTASLTHADADRLFRLIRRLSAEGTAVLYVSHRLEEVLDLADRITVLRGGRVAARFARDEADVATLVSAMSGEPAARPVIRQATAPPTGPALLSVDRLSTRDGRVSDVSFELYPGEILGIYGLAGAGRTELLEALAGLRTVGGGQVRPAAGTGQTRVLIPEDRRGQGLIGPMSVRENVTLSALGGHTRLGVMSRASERRAVQGATAGLHLQASGPEQPVTELSGGNQQKVVFARALARTPGVWLCDEPTQAVDVMTRRAIHDLLRTQAAGGAGVVFVTSDLHELLDVSDRVVVLRAGRSVATLSGDALQADTVLGACYGTPGSAGEGRRAAH